MSLSSFASHLDAFLARKRETTARLYRSAMCGSHGLESFLSARGADLAALTTELCERWILSRADDVSNNSLVAYWKMLASFVAYLVRKQVLQQDPTVNGCPIRSEEGRTRFLEKREVQAIISAANTATAKMAIKLLYHGGFRRNELRQVKLDEVTRVPGQLKLQVAVVGKGGRKRGDSTAVQVVAAERQRLQRPRLL